MTPVDKPFNKKTNFTHHRVCYNESFNESLKYVSESIRLGDLAAIAICRNMMPFVQENTALQKAAHDTNQATLFRFPLLFVSAKQAKRAREVKKKRG